MTRDREEQAHAAKVIEGKLLSPTLMERMGLKPGDFEGAVKEAERQLQAGNHAAAIRIFGMLVLMDPANVEFQINLSQAALGAGMFEIALQSAVVVISSAPDRAEGYFLSGSACQGLEDFDAAIQDFTDAERFATAKGQTDLAKEAARKLAHLKAARS